MKKAHILYFDDEIFIMTTEFGGPLCFILEYIESLDIVNKIDRIDRPEDAEKAMKENNYDLLILDIRIEKSQGGERNSYKDIPWERTGVELIRRIREGDIKGKTTLSVPIIVITAVTDVPTLQRIELHGKGKDPEDPLFIRIIQKPPRLADIGRAIQDAISWIK